MPPVDLVYSMPVREASPDLMAFQDEVQREAKPEKLRLVFGFLY